MISQPPTPTGRAEAGDGDTIAASMVGCKAPGLGLGQVYSLKDFALARRAIKWGSEQDCREGLLRPEAAIGSSVTDGERGTHAYWTRAI